MAVSISGRDILELGGAGSLDFTPYQTRMNSTANRKNVQAATTAQEFTNTQNQDEAERIKEMLTGYRRMQPLIEDFREVFTIEGVDRNGDKRDAYQALQRRAEAMVNNPEVPDNMKKPYMIALEALKQGKGGVKALARKMNELETGISGLNIPEGQALKARKAAQNAARRAKTGRAPGSTPSPKDFMVVAEGSSFGSVGDRRTLDSRNERVVQEANQGLIRFAPNQPTPSTKGQEKEAGTVVDRFAGFQTQADSARNMDQNLDQIEQSLGAIEEAGVRTGTGAQTMTQLKSLGTTLFDMDFEGMEDLEGMRALSRRLALEVRNPESGLGLPGATSNRDLIFLSEAVPGLSNTIEGNRMIVRLLREVNQGKKRIASRTQKILDKYRGKDGVITDAEYGRAQSELDKFLNDEVNGEDYDLIDAETMKEAQALMSQLPQQNNMPGMRIIRRRPAGE